MRCLCRTATLLAAVALSLPARAQPPSGAGGARLRYVFNNRDAYVLLLPQPVAPPGVSWAAWSPSGRYVLARREFIASLPPILVDAAGVPPGEVVLSLWSARTRRAA